ncbi:hypothetical protein M9194_09145 [Vibrio sp. S4M6]|uniref:hypothetical protein n=1 Tax=Vibrio sinus TaxID=2946865 RepID=UPI002029E91E|nr:hypothetical protein [Vibrio sinus]MCL9781590.1 hypothetical protein [Vibrio sinus]
MSTSGSLSLSPKEFAHNFTHPGIEFSTPNEIKVYAASKFETILGAKTALIAGNYFSTNIGPTNKIYAAEYGQWYPGYKIDVDGVSKKWSFLNAHYAAYKQNSYLTKIESLQSEYQVAMQHLQACQTKAMTATTQFDYTDFQASKRKLKAANEDVALFKQYVSMIKADAVAEQKKLVSKINEAHVDRVRAAVIEGDIEIRNKKLTML